MTDQVDIKQLAQCFDWDVKDGVSVADARVVDQDRGRAEIRANIICRFANVVSGSNITTIVPDRLPLS